MGIHDRDWYKEWQQKKDGYTEKATFRISETQRQKDQRNREWWRFYYRVIIHLFALIGFLSVTKKYLVMLLS